MKSIVATALFLAACSSSDQSGQACTFTRIIASDKACQDCMQHLCPQENVDGTSYCKDYIQCECPGGNYQGDLECSQTSQCKEAFQAMWSCESAHCSVACTP